ncbi:hypothetical protein AYL99_03602 [Fonsecaea erecta]|uniref:Uncharacterized protein n=1 Tax=Fonsecaea erecta TaxID=1367422 RepID=A0A178ZNK8_9EURO|nr:hypothetical protein AYL99_03602 [Fonsecaea erecta]OAP61399.1 hypothetical protein AYL99_03602 [Fonsecaea erecta]
MASSSNSRLISRTENSLPTQSQQSSSVLSEHHRLQVGIDFGTTTSSVCYDVITKLSPLQDQELAKVLVDQPQNPGCHRIPSVAFVFTAIDNDNSRRMVLKFGEHPGREHTGRIVAQFQLIKMALLPVYNQASEDPITKQSLQSLKETHDDGLRRIKAHASGQKLYSQDPLTGEMILSTVDTMEDLIRLFLVFLWRLTMRHFATILGETVEFVIPFFQDRVGIAISCPVLTQDDPIMDVYHRLLDAAGYPKSTWVLSEAKSAALYHIATKLAQANEGEDQEEKILGNLHKQATIVMVDIGGGTTDICAITPTEIDEESIVFGDCVGSSTPNGSLKLNEIFKRRLQAELPQFLRSIDARLGCNEAQIAESYAARFEIVKRTVPQLPPHYLIDPDLNIPELIQEPLPPRFVEAPKTCKLSSQQMQYVYDTWLTEIFETEIFELVNRVISQSGENSSGRLPVIVLNGWGALPCYVFQAFQHHWGPWGFDVQMVKDLEKVPGVCQGNFLALTTQKIVRRKIARASFCTATLHQENLFFVIDGYDPIQLLIYQNEDLGNPNKQFRKTCALRANNPVFPVTLKVVIASDRAFSRSPPKLEGTIQVELQSLEQYGFQLQSDDGTLFLEFEYSVELCMRGLLTWLILTVPHTGNFDNVHRDTGKDMLACQQVDIQKHASQLQEVYAP